MSGLRGAGKPALELGSKSKRFISGEMLLEGEKWTQHPRLCERTTERLLHFPHFGKRISLDPVEGGWAFFPCGLLDPLRRVVV